MILPVPVRAVACVVCLLMKGGLGRPVVKELGLGAEGEEV
jgi:hypothetical protein